MSPALAELFDPRVASHAVSYSDVLDPLHDEEARLVERAVEKRRHEFRAGRHCARRALAKLGLGVGPVLRQASRAPLWPAGCVGSITHTGDLSGGYAAAVVAPTSIVRGLGVDAESDSPLGPDLWERILVPSEQRFLKAQAPAQRGALSKLFFSAKEAFYKCQYPVTERFLAFEEVQLELNLEQATFEVSFRCALDDLLREVSRAEGRFFIGDGLILAGAQLLQRDPAAAQ